MDNKADPSSVYGVMSDGEGRPVSVQVCPGNTADPKAVVDQVEKVVHELGF